MVSHTQDLSVLPDFFLIGAARSGTSALTQYLEQHPGIFITDPKEPHYFAFRQSPPQFCGPGDSYFNRNVVVDDVSYQKLFRNAEPGQITGDASVSYLYYTDSLTGINEANPNARIVCLLRQPVDRAYSAYMYLRSRLLEPDDCFQSAYDREAERIRANWHHLWHYEQLSHYRSQLEAVQRTFDSEQVLYLTYDEFRESPLAVVSRCYDFLGVDSNFTPATTPESLVSGEPRFRMLQSVLQSDLLKSCLRPVLPANVRNRIQAKTSRLNISNVALDCSVRSSLTTQFQDDIEFVEQSLLKKLPWSQ